MLAKKTTLSVAATIAALKAGIEAQGLRLVAHIDGQANAAKLGVTVPADQILEVFRPDFAIRVWQACKPAGLDIPLRIHVYEDAAGVHIACRLPTTVFGVWNDAPLLAIAEELDPLFCGILEHVPES